MSTIVHLLFLQYIRNKFCKNQEAIEEVANKSIVSKVTRTTYTIDNLRPFSTYKFHIYCQFTQDTVNNYYGGVVDINTRELRT